jgi:hypothetical protein
MHETVVIDSILAEVIDRLYRNRGMIAEIYYALPILRYEFGEEAEFLLEPYHDPECGSPNSVHLIVRCTEYPENFTDRIAKCRSHLHSIGRLGHGILITTDFGKINASTTQVSKDRIRYVLKRLEEQEHIDKITKNLNEKQKEDFVNGYRCAFGNIYTRLLDRSDRTTGQINGLPDRELKLVVYLLKLAADEFDNHGCNDVDKEVYMSWTGEKRRAFVKAYHEYNGDPEVYDEHHLDLPDYSLMGFLASKLEKLEGTE